MTESDHPELALIGPEAAGRPVRVAVVGCGFYGANHLNAWADLSSQGAQLVAVCDNDPLRARAASQRHGVPWFREVGELLDGVEADLLDIVTRVDSHFPIVSAAAGRVGGIVVQKPLARNMNEAEDIVAAAETAGTWLAVHENFRFQPTWRTAGDLVRGGAIGRPNWARISFRTGFDVYSAQPYFLTERRLAIADVGIHILDLARWLLGEVGHLTAEVQQRNPRLQGEDTATLLMRHVTGAVSVADCTYEMRRLPDPFPDTLGEIEGEHGGVLVRPGGIVEVTSQGRHEVITVPIELRPWMSPDWAMSQTGALAACRHYLHRFAARDAAETSGRDNLCTFALVEAAYESAATGQKCAPKHPRGSMST